MATITFGATTIWDSSTTGRGQSVQVTPIKNEAIVSKAPQGTGYWIKPDGKSLGSVTLSLIYQATDRYTILTAVEALDQFTLQTLTVPALSETEDIYNCRLADYNINFVNGAPDIVTATLIFERYPA